MIAVNLRNTWPKVQPDDEEGRAKATLGSWANISDESLEKHADAILGIYNNEVVSAYDIESWVREENRVRFIGRPSERWKHLIGTENPGKKWTQGMARPIQMIPTSLLTDGDVPIEDTPEGRRAVVEGYILTVEDGVAIVQVPPGGSVIVRQQSSN